ncbi:MAG: hypothetical protein J7539_16495 [Niabella sp.]|nr:hypothetical protein [Niabella sp.]
MMRISVCRIALAISVLSSFTGNAQLPSPNYDESKVGTYTLPALLTTNGGIPVRSGKEWKQTRRKEVLQLFKDNMYGQYPGGTKDMHFKIQQIDSGAVAGTAIAKQIRIYLQKGEQGPFIDLLLYVPINKKKPVPVFAGLNFFGNQSVSPDEHILISEKYREFLKFKNKNTPVVRGEQERNWCVKELIQHGYGLATAYYGDVELDDSTGWKTGVRSVLSKALQLRPEQWSAMGAWAWELSRILDYLQTDKDIAADKVIVIGHSRLGKAALWAGADDERFAAVISNNSGEGGAALARRNYGQTLQNITKSFPHWYISKYTTYAANVNALPVDQHMLLALMAPRPLYVASASNDRWSDPYGEFLAAQSTAPVYQLFHLKGLGTGQMPPPDTSIGNRVRYHIRTGDHDILLFDWLQYIRFADELVK